MSYFLLLSSTTAATTTAKMMNSIIQTTTLMQLFCQMMAAVSKFTQMTLTIIISIAIKQSFVLVSTTI